MCCAKFCWWLRQARSARYRSATVAAASPPPSSPSAAMCNKLNVAGAPVLALSRTRASLHCLIYMSSKLIEGAALLPTTLRSALAVLPDARSVAATKCTKLSRTWAACAKTTVLTLDGLDTSMNLALLRGLGLKFLDPPQSTGFAALLPSSGFLA